MQDIYKRWEVVSHAALLRAKLAMKRVRKNSQSERNNHTNQNDAEFVKQTKTLVKEYIDDRLTRSGLYMKQRILSTVASTSSLYAIKEHNAIERHTTTIQALQRLLDKRNNIHNDNEALTIDDVSKVLICVGEYLEMRHNGLYTDVLQQLNVRSVGETDLHGLFTNVALEMFSGGIITWAKIVALFAFAGGVAVDCVLAGSPMHVSRVKSWMSEFVQVQLMQWIKLQGGWIGMFDHFMSCRDQINGNRPSTSQQYYYWSISAIVLAFCLLFTAFVAVYFKDPE